MMMGVLASRSGKMEWMKGEMTSGGGICKGGSSETSDWDYKITVNSDLQMTHIDTA